MKLVVIKYLNSIKNRLERETFGSRRVKEIINHIDIVIRFLKIL